VDQLSWYVARATGIVAWVLLAAGVLWGLAISTKAFRGRARPNWMLDLHRFLGGAGVVLVGLHLVALVADGFVHIGPAELLVPFASDYRPAAVAWGVVAMYALVADELTSLLRHRLSKRAWRRAHALGFPLFASATVHGITAGTDAGSPLLWWTYVGVSAAVAGLTAVRIAGALDPGAAVAASRA
jgi:predicted ferric reductase